MENNTITKNNGEIKVPLKQEILEMLLEQYEQDNQPEDNNKLFQEFLSVFDRLQGILSPSDLDALINLKFFYYDFILEFLASDPRFKIVID